MARQGRKIKSGSAEVRCEGGQVVVTGSMVTDSGTPIGGGGSGSGKTIIVSATEPASPATNDLWLEIPA